MNLEIKTLFCTALRGNFYKQGKLHLRKGDLYCFMGVLCDLHAKEHRKVWEKEKAGDVYSYMGFTCILPKPVEIWSGLSTLGTSTKVPFGVKCLIQSNDGTATTIAKSFPEMADIIEAYL